MVDRSANNGDYNILCAQWFSIILIDLNFFFVLFFAVNMRQAISAKGN